MYLVVVLSLVCQWWMVVVLDEQHDELYRRRGIVCQSGQLVLLWQYLKVVPVDGHRLPPKMSSVYACVRRFRHPSCPDHLVGQYG